MTDAVTREIMWNIPAALKYAMYGLLVLSTAYAGLGFYKKYQFVFAGKKVSDLLPEKLNWKILLIRFSSQEKSLEILLLEFFTL